MTGRRALTANPFPKRVEVPGLERPSGVGGELCFAPTVACSVRQTSSSQNLENLALLASCGRHVTPVYWQHRKHDIGGAMSKKIAALVAAVLSTACVGVAILLIG